LPEYKTGVLQSSNHGQRLASPAPRRPVVFGLLVAISNQQFG